ncbi:four helix bundle protein [Candidatus Peregrinibacteria bacterium]|nr:four helix bundle protein [Candidatus Peregrinibacteria bacterium]
MGTFKRFEEIEVWQESRKLVRAVREICKKPEARKDFSFIDQITRSARSVGANIAEGNDALTTPEFISFLSIAKRSAAEVRSHLYDALDEKYISQQEFDVLAELTLKICGMIAKLIHYLQSISQVRRRTLKEPLPPSKNDKP